MATAPPAEPPTGDKAPPAHGLQPNASTSHVGGHGPETRIQLPSRFTLDFGRLNSDYFIRDVTVSINNQNTIAGATYDQLEQLTRLDLPIQREPFIRVWKTLILKRVQDVYENEKCRRADNFVRIIRNILLPAPLADLLTSIGMYYCEAQGIIYHMIPPARDPDPPAWWAVDNAILNAFITTTNRMQHLFTMKEFPSTRDFQGRPIVLTAIQENAAQGTRRVKAFTRGPTPADVMTRFINDDLFLDGIDIDDCHLTAVEPLNRTQVVYDYIRDYCVHSNV